MKKYRNFNPMTWIALYVILHFKIICIYISYELIHACLRPPWTFFEHFERVFKIRPVQDSAVWYQRKWSNKLLVLTLPLVWQQLQGTIDTEHVLFLLAEIIPDNWCCFSFLHKVFVFTISSCSLLIFQCCYQRLTPCAGTWSDSAHWLRTNVFKRYIVQP